MQERQKETSSYIRAFALEHPSATLMEATVDTTSDDDGAPIPYLNLWAWRAFEGKDLERALAQAESADDIGFLYDVLDGVGESCFEHQLSALYPDWPEGIELGDRAILESLKLALSSLPVAMRVWFHHVDVLPVIKISR